MSDSHLEFNQSPATNGTLTFSSFANPGPSETATLAVSLDNTVGFAANAQYDNRTTRYLQSAASASHQVASHVAGRADLSLTPGGKLRGDSSHRWQPAGRVVNERSYSAQTAAKTSRSITTGYQVADGVRGGMSASMQTADKIRTTLDSLYQVAARLGAGADSRMQAAVRAASETAGIWQKGLMFHRPGGDMIGKAILTVGPSAAVGSWQVALRVGPGKRDIIVPPPGHVCYTPSGHLTFEASPALDGSLLFRCDDDIDTPQPPAQIIVPVQKAYLVVNNISLRRVSDNALIKADSVSLSLDADSWTWSFSASVSGDQFDLVSPLTGPVEVKLNVNGTEVRLNIEKVSRSRTFGATSLSVSGRGLNAELDAPYAASQVFGGYETLSAQQLMNQVLTLNGISLGWSIDWQIEDWLVPEGVFNHQGTYISALNAIAGAAGAYVQPSFATKTMSIKHRYPTASWDWAGVTPDIQLPADVVTQEGIDWDKKPDYNRVFVSGQEAGVLCQVTRTGTAGDMLAPMVTDSLIVSAAPGRMRGRAVLSDTGTQARVSLALPVLQQTGIIVPGKFVQYADGTENRRGMVRSVNVSGQLPNVWQTIEVETRV